MTAFFCIILILALVCTLACYACLVVGADSEPAAPPVPKTERQEHPVHKR